MTDFTLYGRSSSHYTRVVRVFAHELGVPLRFAPIYDMTELTPASYGGHPAMKVPCLQQEGEPVFGTENICRTLARAAAQAAGHGVQVTWPEQLADLECGNAQELVWHCMAAQVQVVFGTAIAKLPADNLYFTKAHAGFEGAMAWLDAHVQQVLAKLPAARACSLFEVTLFCLVDHLSFRQTVSTSGYPALLRFAAQWSGRASAQATPYHFDVKPA
jgi:glutathione S-transferase